jgi:ferric reductase like protein
VNHAYWYATRGSGVVALILLTLVVALGVAGSLRLRSDRWPRFLVVGLHRNLTLLSLVFLIVHVVTTVLDSYTPIGLAAAFVPFVSSYRPLWLGLGAVAFDLLLALVVTSLLRARVGYRLWRGLHWLAYAAWPIALVHGLGTGSDARFGWMQALTAACVVTVLAASLWRLRAAGASPALRLLGGAVALIVVVGGAAWYRTGPAARGWAARSGTPSTHAVQAVAQVAAPTTTASLSVPFTRTLHGRLSTHVDHASGLVRIDIRGRAGNGLLWIRLQGEPALGGGVNMTASGAALGPPGAPDEYIGKITALQGTDLALALRNGDGKRIALVVRLNVDQASGTVSGTVRAVPGNGDSE